mgnify:CR=1 FL=1
MKKLATLLLAAGLVFSAFQPASAVELKPYGMFELLFEHGGNMARALQSSADVKPAKIFTASTSALSSASPWAPAS